MKRMKQLLLMLFVAVSVLWADTYNNYSVPLTSSGYTASGLTVKSNDVDRFTITLQSAGQFSAAVTDNSTVKFNVSTSAMPDKSTHTLTSYGPVSYPSGQVLYLSISAPSQNQSQSYTLTLSLATGNTVPVANNDSAETNATAPVVINILANDTDSDGTLVPSSVMIVTSPTKGTPEINTVSGAITYTPNSVDPNKFVGNDTFTYKVQDDDGAWSNIATVTITYPHPVAMDDDFVCPVRTTTNNAYINNNIITNPPSDEKYEDNLIMYSVITQGGTTYVAPWPKTIATTHGSLVIQSDGAFTYTPVVGYSGEDSVTYTIKNGYNLTSNTATVMFYVNNYCADAETLLQTDNTCTPDVNTASGGVQSDDPDYYRLVVMQDGVLDINLTNASGSRQLFYDFGSNCVQLFNKDPDTTSMLDSEVSTVRASMPLSAGTYYLALKGQSKTSDTNYNVSVAFRSACEGEPSITPTRYRTVGINEAGLNYDVNQSITTKIVNSPFGLQVSYLNANGDVAVYSGLYNNTSFPLSVILQSVDDNCQNEKYLGKVDIQPGQSTTIATPLNIDEAAKIKRIKTSVFDLAKYLGDASGVNCQNSSMNSGLCLLPACLNADHKILEVFPPALFPHVMTCVYGDGVGQPPCQALSYYGNCQGSKGAITPDKYNNVYGCGMCLADAMGGDICSEDNFAIRPKNFALALMAPGSPNLLKSGEEQGIAIHAYDAASPGVDSIGYNQTSTNLSIAAIKRMPNDTINNDLNGTASFPNAFTFTNGLSSGANMTFDDVGKITVDLNDTEWADVDSDDTLFADLTIHGEADFTFIPFQFALSNIQIVNSRGGNFTYVSNDLNMSAKFDFNITSQNKQGGTTLNFATGLYEHPLSITPTVVDTVRGDATETTIVSSLTGFTAGVNHLMWDDLNTSKVLKFNFPRNPAVPIDPFEVNATEANLSVNGLYVDGVFSETIENNATNKAGATNGTTGNATFLYGRADAPDYRFAKNTPDANLATYGCGRIFFEFYNPVANNPLVTSIFAGVMPPMSSSPDAGWYQNPLHDSATDGNVTGVMTSAVTVYGHDVNQHGACIGSMSGGGFEKRVFEYDGSFGYPFRSSAALDASDWLDVTGNNFGVEFYKAGEWVGEQSGTKTATDRDAETITNRRILW